MQMTGGISLIYFQELKIWLMKTINVKLLSNIVTTSTAVATKIEHKGKNSLISLDHLSHAIGLIIHQPL